MGEWDGSGIPALGATPASGDGILVRDVSDNGAYPAGLVKEVTYAEFTDGLGGGASNPLTTAGDTLYGGTSGTQTRLPGNTSTTRKFLRQTGTGSASAAPAWDTLLAGDLPAATTSTQGAVILDGTAADIQPSPGTRAAGATGDAADAGHVHGQPPVFAPSGLTGAVQAARFAGGTTSGAPASGTFAVGDFIIDQSGKVWVCTSAGSPGTWVNASAGAVSSFNTRTGPVTPGNADYLAVASGGLTGATAAARFVGGTSSGAPSSGTFAVGDFVVDHGGTMWLCTSAGTPGTWVALLNTSAAQTVSGAKTFSAPVSFSKGILTTGITTVTTDYTASAATDFIILCNPPTADITVTLPDATTCAGQQFTIKNLAASSAHAAVVAGAGSQVIDGQASIVVYVQYTGLSVVSDGSNWHSFASAGAFSTLNANSNISTGSADFYGPLNMHSSAVTGVSALDCSSPAALNGGTDTSGTAAASSPTFTTGTAKQLSTTQDVMLYIAVQTSAALAVAIGSTSSVTTALMPSKSYALGLIPIKVPKGWYVKITGTIADLAITQVTC